MALSLGYVLFSVGMLVTLANFWLSFLDYPVYRVRGGAPETYRGASGLPLFGSGLLWTSMLCLRSQTEWMRAALIISLFDTAGIHWFIGTVLWMQWRDRRGR